VGGCRAPLIDAEIVNQGPQLKLIEFDYPNASFGRDAIDAGGQFHHPFAPGGPGKVTLHFVDSAGRSHTSDGPTVREGESGSLVATIDSAGAVHWRLTATSR
jgi:hypothetical protein